MSKAEDERSQARSEADLIRLARARGYGNPEWWAKRVIAGRENKNFRKKQLTIGGKPV